MLTLLKVDAQRLFERIKYRKVTYMDVFSTRRTREHFPEIFTNKYQSFPANLLVETNREIIVSIDGFYSKADNIKWYLMTTQDMPATVREKLNPMIRELENHFHELINLIDERLNPKSKTFVHLPEIPIQD